MRLFSCENVLISVVIQPWQGVGSRTLRASANGRFLPASGWRGCLGGVCGWRGLFGGDSGCTCAACARVFEGRRAARALPHERLLGRVMDSAGCLTGGRAAQGCLEGWQTCTRRRARRHPRRRARCRATVGLFERRRTARFCSEDRHARSPPCKRVYLQCVVVGRRWTAWS